VAHIDQVLGPADDTVTFFQPRAMVFVTMLWVVAAVWVAGIGLHVLVRIAVDQRGCEVGAAYCVARP